MFEQRRLFRHCGDESNLLTEVVIIVARNVGSMSILGGHNTLRALFLNKEGAFSNNKKSFLV